MPRMRIVQTNFTAGELSRQLLGRTDLRGYENGAARLRNVIIHPTGGISRRPGLRAVDSLDAATARLIEFEFNTEQVYLLVLCHLELRVYREDILMTTVATPWTGEQLAQLNWTQNADTLFICHPEVAPRRITRSGHAAWSVEPFAFLAEDAEKALRQPYFRFVALEGTIQPSATVGTVTLTASEDVFVAGHAGSRFRIAGREVEIAAIAGPRVATALVHQTLTGTAPTADWEEAAFSAVRGWPIAVTFHQDRLVFGGSRDLPNRLWMSKAADITNFDLGTGLDDESIEIALLSDQVNAIRAVFSSRHLQVFTTGAEWVVDGEPLSPAKVRAHRQTRIGSVLHRSLPPRSVDGATLFAARTGRGIREFLYADDEQSYQSTDLGVLSGHVFADPVDQDFDQLRRLFCVVMGDGTLATLTIFRTEQVLAWTVQETAGRFLAIACVGDSLYALVQRAPEAAGPLTLERFEEGLCLDGAVTRQAAEPATAWEGFEAFEGHGPRVLADGHDIGECAVQDGVLATPFAATEVTAGHPFAHVIEPLAPPASTGRGTVQAVPVRLVRAVFRLHATRALRADAGLGLRAVPLQRFGPDALEGPGPAYTGDRELRGIGWRRGPMQPLWRIEQADPYPFTLLSVVTELMVSD